MVFPGKLRPKYLDIENRKEKEMCERVWLERIRGESTKER